MKKKNNFVLLYFFFLLDLLDHQKLFPTLGAGNDNNSLGL
jgi:hypothetical protein